MDFGALKEVKDWLEEEWDHRVLIASDDPLIPQLQDLEILGGINLNILPKKYGPGIEQSCKYVYDEASYIVDRLTDGAVWISEVKIFEHENNWATFEP